jgi:Mrp family chromosome partitioning ATPase
MKPLIAELKKEYDYVILDTPPILLISDALVLMQHVDTALLVTNTSQSSRRGIRHLEDLLEQNSLSHASFVLNGIKPRRLLKYYSKYAARYGYYSYGSGYAEGYGYGETYVDNV